MEPVNNDFRKKEIIPISVTGVQRYVGQLFFKINKKGGLYPTSLLLVFSFECTGRKDRMSPKPMAAAQRHPQNAIL